MQLEDSDVEEGTYIPLARPEAFNPPSLVHMQIQDEQSDEASAQDSSGSDSDDELRRRAKRTKIRPRRPQPQPNKKDKYNIWCKALEVNNNHLNCNSRIYTAMDETLKLTY